MKVIIAGTRTFSDYELLKSSVEELQIEITKVISGHAEGADLLGERYAHENGIGVIQFPAKWREYGKGAGPIRNREMANDADILIAFWDGESPGTKNMISNMERLGKTVHIVLYKMNQL